jgi:5-methylcytosine-specific restriction endonuclease McrA
MTIGEKTYWHFRNRWYSDNDGLSADEVEVLLVARDKKLRASIKRAESLVATEQNPEGSSRYIPEDVKLTVMSLDQGRCRRCGATSDLQFDHIIPVSQGGGASIENVQLLCGPCNREKNDSVSWG